MFRFDAGVHRYTAGDTGEHLPSVTQMLKATGHIETTWMTEAGRDRGTAVHALTAAYDLAALDLARCVSPFKGYLMGHVHAMQVLRPELLAVEEPIVHPLYRYGGRPDRDVKIDGLRGVLEIKTGGQEDWHSLQTALLAILVAEEAHLQAERLGRWMLYLKASGRWTLEEQTRVADFIEARRIIMACCGKW